MNNNKMMIVIALTLFAVTAAFGAGTPAGTVISNTAYGNYKDANSNDMPQVSSNTVETTVTQIAGVSVGPDGNTVLLPSMGSVYVPLTVTNTGNGNDTYDLSSVINSSGSSSYTREIYSDLNGNGSIDLSDALITVTPSMIADETFDIIIVITDTGVGIDGDVVTVDVTGTSQFLNTVSDASDITATVGSPTIVITPSVDNPAPLPGELITYTYCIANDGSATAYNMTFVGPIPTNTTYYVESITVASVGQTDADDAPTDYSDYNITNAGEVTAIVGDIASGGSICVTYTVIVNSGVPNATPIVDDPVVTYEDGSGNPYPPEYPSITVTVGTSYAIDVTPDSSTTGDPDDEVVFIVLVENLSNTSDIINMTYTDSWTWALYLDDGNGTYEGTESLLTDSNSDSDVDVGAIAAFGSVTIFAVASIPPGTADADVHIFTLDGTSAGNSFVTANAVFTITTTAPFITLLKSVSPTGNQPPGTTLTYSVIVSNTGTGGATSVIISDAVPTNTSYVAGSLFVDNVPVSDAVDSDAGTYDGSSVIFGLDQLASTGSKTVTFQVVIN